MKKIGFCLNKNARELIVENPIERDEKLKEKISEIRLKLMEIGLATKKAVDWNLMKSLIRKEKGKYYYFFS